MGPALVEVFFVPKCSREELPSVEQSQAKDGHYLALLTAAVCLGSSMLRQTLWKKGSESRPCRSKL